MRELLAIADSRHVACCKFRCIVRLSRGFRPCLLLHVGEWLPLHLSNHLLHLISAFEFCRQGKFERTSHVEVEVVIFCIASPQTRSCVT